MAETKSNSFVGELQRIFEYELVGRRKEKVERIADDWELRALVKWRQTAPEQLLLDNDSVQARKNEDISNRLKERYNASDLMVSEAITVCEAAIESEIQGV